MQSAEKPKPYRFRRYLHLTYRRHSHTSQIWRRRLTPAGWVVVIAIVGTGAVGMNTNATTAYQLCSLLVAMFTFSMLLTITFRPRLKIVRHIPSVASAGAPFTYTITIQNTKRRRYTALRTREYFGVQIPPLEAFLYEPEPEEHTRNWFDRTLLFYRWLWLMDRIRLAEEEVSDTFEVPPDGQVSVEMQLTPKKRGILRWSEMHIEHADAFGLIKYIRKAHSEWPDTITVLPKRYPLPHISLAGNSQYQPYGVSLAGSVGQSEEFVGLREYRPGDPIRHIHWKSSAKVGTPIVMEFSDEFVPRYALVLDTFASYNHGDIFEEAVSVAASFVCTLDTKESLLDLMFVGTEAYHFTSGRGTSQPEQLLEILAAVELCRDRPFSNLSELVQAHVRELSSCVCIFIDWDDDRQDCIRKLRSMGVEVLPLLIGSGDEALSEEAARFGVHYLEASRVAEGLAKL